MKQAILNHLRGLYHEAYQRFGQVKKGAGDEYMMLCPFHDDHNPSLSFNGTNGLFNCFACDAKGDFLEFYAKVTNSTGLGFPVLLKKIAVDFALPVTPDLFQHPQAQPDATESNRHAAYWKAISKEKPSSAIVDYLKHRQIDSVLEYMKHHQLIGFSKQGNCIYFPVHLPNGELCGTQKIPINGAKKEFAFGTNAKDGLLVLPGEGRPVVVEAVIDAISLKRSTDRPVIVIFSSTMTGKLKHLELVNPILFFDRDKAGYKATVKALATLGGARAVDWSKAPSGLEDVNELLCAGHRDLITEMVETAPAYDALGKPLPRFEVLDGWLSQEPDPIDYVFDGFLPRHVIGVIAARGGTGKTFLLLQLILASVMGANFLDLFRPVSPLKVVAVLSEDPVQVIRTRIYFIVKHMFGHQADLHQIEIVMNNNLRLLCAPLGALMKYDGQGNPEPTDAFKWLEAQAEVFKPDLVILDPKAQLYGLDENNNDHNTTWVNTLKRLTAQGASVIFTHHVPKGQGGLELDAVRGGSSLTDACRWVMMMGPMDKVTAGKKGVDDEVWRYVCLQVAKNSYAPAGQGETYLERREHGVLERVDFEFNLVDAVARKIAVELAQYYADTGERLSRRELLRKKNTRPIRDAIKEEIPAGSRAVLEAAIEYGIANGVLSTERYLPDDPRRTKEIIVPTQIQ